MKSQTVTIMTKTELVMESLGGIENVLSPIQNSPQPETSQTYKTVETIHDKRRYDHVDVSVDYIPTSDDLNRYRRMNDKSKLVLGLCPEQLTSKELADELNLDYYTVRNIIQLLRNKFECNTKEELEHKSKGILQAIHDKEKSHETEVS